MLFNNATGQGLRARGLPGLGRFGSMVDLTVPYTPPRGTRLSSMVDLSVPYHLPRGGVAGMVDLKLNGLGAYGVSASDVGTGIGTAAGSLLSNLFGPHDGTGAAYTNPYPGGTTGLQYPTPSWWAQQSTSTKVMVAGAGFAAVAAGIAFLRGKASRRSLSGYSGKLKAKCKVIHRKSGGEWFSILVKTKKRNGKWVSCSKK